MNVSRVRPGILHSPLGCENRKPRVETELKPGFLKNHVEASSDDFVSDPID